MVGGIGNFRICKGGGRKKPMFLLRGKEEECIAIEQATNRLT